MVRFWSHYADQLIIVTYDDDGDDVDDYDDGDDDDDEDIGCNNDGDNERQLAGGLAREDSSFSHFLSYHLIPSFQIVFNTAFGIHGMQRKEHSAV